MHAHPPTIPALDSNFVTPLSVAERGVRGGLKPLNIVQPQGPSFQVASLVKSSYLSLEMLKEKALQ